MAASSPPGKLDGAAVLYWLASENGEPFYFVREGAIRHPISGMAICRYADSGSLYLFKCDSNWQVWADWDCGSVEEAMEMVEKSQGIPHSTWRQMTE